ncbi:MAG: hypothetical protein JXX14_16000 [Deltaproteobacteria bacterium]|nr:hypothetical protein [Deltaproteobacteria bacterium]
MASVAAIPCDCLLKVVYHPGTVTPVIQPISVALYLAGVMCVLACSAPSPSAVRAPDMIHADTETADASAYVLPAPANAYGLQAPEPLGEQEEIIWQKVVALLGDGCVLDGSLTRAARKHAVDLTENPLMTQENGIDYLRFALRYFGSTDYLVSPAVYELPDNGDKALRQILGNASDEWTHCGVGVHDANGQARVVFIAATRMLSLNAIPVQPTPGKPIDVRGKLNTDGASAVEAFLEQPNGGVQQLNAFVVGKARFQVSVPIGDAGKYKLELQVTRPSGPETALLVPLYVGIDVETRPSVFPIEHDVVENPGNTLTVLLNRIRQNMGLSPLKRDTRLDGVARKHCEDMVASSTFGHFSTRSGKLSDRLQAQGLYPRLSAENIGLSSSMMRVHHNLMQSPSHKIKVLTPEFTHLGLGIVSRNGQTMVTQIFAAW